MRLGEAGTENPADTLFTGLMRLQVRLCPMPPMLLVALNTAVDRHTDQPTPCPLPAGPVHLYCVVDSGAEKAQDRVSSLTN